MELSDHSQLTVPFEDVAKNPKLPMLLCLGLLYQPSLTPVKLAQRISGRRN